MTGSLRLIPSVEKVLSHERVKALEAGYPHGLIVDIVREELERERRAIAEGGTATGLGEIAEAVCRRIAALGIVHLRPVINATGVILHTNLGRAPLSPEAAAAMQGLSGYCDLEFDLETGERGSRHVHIEPLLRQLTGAPAALVVNNNAAAVLLCLTALAKRREVIVSRGQAVEIGGGFRVPDVMRQSGAKLIEVGTTNCTYIADFEQALTPHTATLLRVHSSNFKVVGFAADVSVSDLAGLGAQHGIPVLDDLGSGALLDTSQYKLSPEPMVQHSVAAGAALVCFSGDKLVGGPQAGIIVGKTEYISKLKKHPLARAMRLDKLRLAALSATLIHYLKGEAVSKVPVWRMIAAPAGELERRALLWAEALGEHAQVIEGESMVGGGSLPGGTLPTRLVALRNSKVQTLARRLRSREIPVIGRISGSTLLLDPRSVLPEDDPLVIAALRELAAGG